MYKNDSVSRFFTEKDLKFEKFMFNLPPSWWSRPYEYAWASRFAEPEDVALDAASGICHPLKFYLLDNCREVHACDIDDRILLPEEILKEIADIFGEEILKNFPRRYLQDIHYKKAPLTTLSYADQKFNKIYCISALEHLNDTFNRHPIFGRVKTFNRFFPRDIYVSLKEFKRTLKDDGSIILTFDYPRINLEYFKKIISDLRLVFTDSASFRVPGDALYFKEKKLYCFRAVLRKES